MKKESKSSSRQHYQSFPLIGSDEDMPVSRRRKHPHAIKHVNASTSTPQAAQAALGALNNKPFEEALIIVSKQVERLETQTFCLQGLLNRIRGNNNTYSPEILAKWLYQNKQHIELEAANASPLKTKFINISSRLACRWPKAAKVFCEQNNEFLVAFKPQVLKRMWDWHKSDINAQFAIAQAFIAKDETQTVSYSSRLSRLLRKTGSMFAKSCLGSCFALFQAKPTKSTSSVVLGEMLDKFCNAPGTYIKAKGCDEMMRMAALIEHRYSLANGKQSKLQAEAFTTKLRPQQQQKLQHAIDEIKQRRNSNNSIRCMSQ